MQEMDQKIRNLNKSDINEVDPLMRQIRFIDVDKNLTKIEMVKENGDSFFV
jgi:hypothetical protein